MRTPRLGRLPTSLNAWSELRAAIPKGLNHLAQGCAPSATLGVGVDSPLP